MFKRKEKKPGYEVNNLGSFIVERVQLPHALTEADGSRYEVLTWIYRIRIEDGPVLYERDYVSGTEEAIQKLNTHLLLGTPVESEHQAKYSFYNSLAERINNGTINA